jgi:hypothetical protein
MAKRIVGRGVIDLVAALRAVVEALENDDVAYIIVGSTAAAAWGVIRATRDVDLVAELTTNSLELLLKRLGTDAFYIPTNDARHSTLFGGSFNVLHLPSGGKVDIFVPQTNDAFTKSRMKRRIRSEVIGIVAWIATPEDVVLAKLRWRIESRSEVQWRDCVEIAATHSLDGDYMNIWAPHLNVAADLEELLRTGEPSSQS